MAKPVPPPPPPPSAPIDVNLREALEERYLAYALSTIMGRALPDARDGLKPVHRRILYGMHILKLDPGSAFKKCAKIVGDVMGSFHPHGDQAIYEALVRLAQDFASRYPLIEGQGNFGNIDGDNAAAYRYTEARMTDVARLLMEGVEEDAVDWRDNYSGDTQEPIVMPSAVPNLLANGAQGIAVGMATSIPPHNIAELCDAALYLIAHPGAEAEALAEFVPGPDFPTGGVVIDDKAAIVETYRTGRGAFRLRARWTKEDAGRGGWVAVVTQIPYGVQKSRLIEQIANLLNERKLPLLADVRDESTEDVRIVLEPRTRAVEPETLMESLFKLTELESRVSVNMNVLVDGVTPRVVSLERSAAAMARPSPRGARAPLAPSARGDRQAARTAGRHDRRLSQSRRGHPHHSRGRRAEGGAQGPLRADRAAGRLHPRHAPAQLAPPRGDGAAQGAGRSHQGEGLDRGAARQRAEAMADDRGRNPRRQKEIRARHQARQAAHQLRGRARRRRRRSRRGDDRARAADHPGLAERLDPGAERPGRRSLRRHLQGRRRLENLVLRRDDLEDSGAGERRQGLHARRRQIAGRTRAGRADPAHGRHRRERRDRRRLGLRGRARSG